jgi:hypothetical protein
MSIDESIEILTIHRARLLETKTFEEYRDAHVAYVDMLIERYRGDLKKREASETFMRWEAVVKTAEEVPAPNADK